MSTHYSLAQQPEKLKSWAESVAKNILSLGITPMLCYSGMSGISSATALMLELHSLNIDVQMCYVRKAHEESHGEPVEVSTHSTSYELIFVDDFISSGATFRRVENAIELKIKYVALQDRNFCLPRLIESSTKVIYGE